MLLPAGVQTGSGSRGGASIRLLDSRTTSTYTSRGVEGLALRNPGNHRQVTDGKVPIPGDVWRASRSSPHVTQAKVYSEGAPNGCQSSSVQRVQGGVPAGGPVRLRAVLRPARGRLRPQPPRR